MRKTNVVLVLTLALVLFSSIGCQNQNVVAEFEEIKVQAGDVTLHVRIVGNPKTGNVLVAVNGGPGQSSHYMASLEHLASKDFAVVTYDQRGTGRSTSPSDDDYIFLRFLQIL